MLVVIVMVVAWVGCSQLTEWVCVFVYVAGVAPGNSFLSLASSASFGSGPATMVSKLVCVCVWVMVVVELVVVELVVVVVVVVVELVVVVLVVVSVAVVVVYVATTTVLL